MILPIATIFDNKLRVFKRCFKIAFEEMLTMLWAIEKKVGYAGR